MGFLGIDTSNYTTSAAIVKENGEVIQLKSPLPVAEGAVGLRQSDAVFAHVTQLGPLLDQFFSENRETITAVGVSATPRDEAGSYMPCFLAGKMCAQSIAAAVNVPLYEFSHQSGHIAAVLYSTKLTDLFDRDFIAFHVSGGTTQCLLVQPDETGAKLFKITTVAQSLDLHAGQVIDRVGAMLGLKFPAGMALEELASGSEKKYPVKIAFKGLDCCLSGIENQCMALLAKNEKPCDIARFCIDCIDCAVCNMTKLVLEKYPNNMLLYAGGVMSNRIIRENVTRQFDKISAGVFFASPEFSSDNAAGIAVLCKKSYRKERGDT